MAYSVANQKTIHINKHRYEQDFLQVSNSEWMAAYKVLRPSAFAIYLYFAGNINDYTFSLSQADIQNRLNIKKTAYYSAIQELIENGYLQANSSGYYEFYCVSEKTEISAKTVQKQNINNLQIDLDNNIWWICKDDLQDFIKEGMNYKQIADYLSDDYIQVSESEVIYYAKKWRLYNG